MRIVPSTPWTRILMQRCAQILLRNCLACVSFSVVLFVLFCLFGSPYDVSHASLHLSATRVDWVVRLMWESLGLYDAHYVQVRSDGRFPIIHQLPARVYHIHYVIVTVVYAALPFITALYTYTLVSITSATCSAAQWHVRRTRQAADIFASGQVSRTAAYSFFVFVVILPVIGRTVGLLFGGDGTSTEPLFPPSVGGCRSPFSVAVVAGRDVIALLPAVICALMPALYMFSRVAVSHNKDDAPRCPYCDYITIGLSSARCPECGTEL